MVDLYKNILVVDSSVMSDSELRYLRRTKQIDIVRRSAPGCKALISYESLPQHIKDRLGVKNPYELVKKNLIEGYIVRDASISDWFEGYKLADGRHLPSSKQVEYYNNAIILEAIGKMLDDKRAIRASKGKRLVINWKELAEGVAELDRAIYKHNLPLNERRLQATLNRYKSEGYVSLISGKFNNINSAKVNDSVKASVMVELISDPRNFDNEQICRYYNVMAGQMNWKSITGATVAVWRDKLSVEAYAGRRGSSAFRNKMSMQVKRSAPTQPLYYWTLDGWDVELMYQKTEKGVTTYHNRPTVVVVLDACLKYPIGYAVGTHETPELITEALRDAAKHTAELFGKMYRAHQIQSDRYSVKKLTPVYEAMGKKFTPARAHNAKAKVIESYFNSINKKYCQTQPNWSGFGITSDRDKQPNTEFLQKYKSNFPDFAGVKKQISWFIEMERLQLADRMKELWIALEEDKKVELSFESYLLHFGQTNGKTQRLAGNGLTATIGGRGVTYDCFDIEFRRHRTTDWRVLYDTEDLSKALAVNSDGTLRFMLEQKYVQPMALIERSEGDSEELQRVRQYNESLEGYVSEFRENSHRTLQEAMVEHPALKDTLSKILITDSTGQHKNVKSKTRLLSAKAEEVVHSDERLEWLQSKVDVSKYIMAEQ